jgi:hypothetical protein
MPYGEIKYNNFAKAKIKQGGINATAGTIKLASASDISRFPDPTVGGSAFYYATVWDSFYGDPADDPDVEAVLITFRSGSSFLNTVRGQLGTTARAHNTVGRTYYIAQAVYGHELVAMTRQHRPVVLINPGASADRTIMYVADAINIIEMDAVLLGSSSPSVTWTVRHGADRNGTGIEVVTGGTVTTTTTTKHAVTTFNNGTVIAGNHLWIETTAQSGTVGELCVTLHYSVLPTP